MLEYCRQHKAVALVPILLILLVGIFLAVRPPAYAVVIDGKEGFIVKHSADVKSAIAELSTQKIDGQVKKLELGSSISYKRVFVSRDQIVSSEEVKEQLKSHLNFQIPAAAIVVNGKTVAYVNDKETADKLLANLKTAYSWIADGEKLASVEFEEKVQVKETKVAVSRVITDKQAWSLLTTGTSKPEEYTVHEGDTLWTIAQANNMCVDDILKANKLTEDDVLDLGQKIILNKIKPYVNVIAKVEGQRNETIPFQTQVVVDKKAAYSVKVTQEGVQGEKQISYLEVRCNGVAETKNDIEEKVIKSAVDKVIVKGTRIVTVASRGGVSGSLAWPLYGTITQPFKGSAHTGLDIGVSTGTPVRAADSGVITFAGNGGGYGNFIIINHGNGMVTRYAHCSRISVSVGTHVSRGQVIGLSGSTGHSTGPHLHFEVMINGSFTNPLSSLR